MSVTIGLHSKLMERIFNTYSSNHYENDNEIFRYFANEVDTILKPAYSVTIRLLKNGREYFNTFEKF